MSRSTIPVNGGAMPKFNRGAVMRRAWEIFRQTYKYPQIKFADIGRKYFAWALRKAWAEAHEAPRVAAIPAQERAGRIETLRALISRADYVDCFPQWKAEVTAYRNEIRQLQSV